MVRKTGLSMSIKKVTAEACTYYASVGTNRNMRYRLLSLSFLGLLLLPACSGSSAQGDRGSSNPSQEPPLLADRLPTPTPFPRIIVPEIVQLSARDLPDYFASIPPDGIRPVYDPRFANAQDAPLQPDELVMGVTENGEAKAYPVTVLRFREIVNDEIGGRPILVTW